MLFILKVLWRSNNLMQKMTSLTPYIYEIIHLKVFLKHFAQNFSPYYMVLDKPRKGPVHLELFSPSVIRGPWVNLLKVKTTHILTLNGKREWHSSIGSRLGALIYNTL
jgi:hypothetical protein